ncbi:MAG: hypothetical protein RSD55_05830 [Lachnospiraceae bacterium]
MKIIEEYNKLIHDGFDKYHPMVIAYGSNCYGDSKSDLDVCIIVDNTFDKEKEIISKTINFSKIHSLRIDTEIPYENKLIFTYDEVREILSKNIFLNNKNKFEILDIQKDSDFLSSNEMRSRLLLNILTTDHVVTNGNREFVRKCEEKSWNILMDALISCYSLNNESTIDKYLEHMYRNPYTGKSGEDYLGYKKHYPRKDIYLRKQLSFYLDKRKK